MRYSTECPMSERPWCLKCRRVMGIQKRQPLTWICGGCRAQAVAHQIVLHKVVKPVLVSDARRNAKQDWRTRRPECVTCHKRMYRSGSRKRVRWGCWHCNYSIFAAVSAPPVTDMPPCCVACRKPMDRGGVEGQRRWGCRPCKFSILANGAGRGLKPRKQHGPLVPLEEYRAALRKLSDAASIVLKAFRGQNVDRDAGLQHELAAVKRKASYLIKQTPSRDREAMTLAMSLPKR